MVNSMTGYGNDTFQLNGTVITTEVKSVNSRYLDIIPKIPRSLQEIEFDLKKLIQTHFNRGRIELYISITGESLKTKHIHTDWELLDQFLEQLHKIKEKYQLNEQLSLADIASQEELFVIQEEDRTDKSFHTLLFESVKRACEHVQHSRKQEGENLLLDIVSRIEYITDCLNYIDQNSEEVQQQYKKRIEERIIKHIDHELDMDRHYLIQEVALLAEKGDIQEEITRLHSHLKHFNKVISHKGEIGRKLDFIIQEMHRETNTIGSKSINAEISEHIVIMKSELEKIKEQLQNIE